MATSIRGFRAIIRASHDPSGMDLRPIQFRRDIAVVEAVKVDACFFQKFKKDAHALLGILNRIGTIIPGSQRCAATKGVGQWIAHDMPVGGGKAQVIAHGLPLDQLIGVVLLKGKGIAGLGAFVINDGYFREEAHLGLCFVVTTGIS